MEQNQVERRVLDAVGRAMGRFSMLRPGNRVAVAVSGGRDSLCLLHAMVSYQRRAPFRYDLVAVTVEQGNVTEDLTTAYARVRGLLPVGCVCGDKEGVRREIRGFVAGLKTRYPGIGKSVEAALGNINPYALFDPALTKKPADFVPTVVETLCLR